MIGHLMTSLHFNIWKVKIWLSQEQKELSKWNKPSVKDEKFIYMAIFLTSWFNSDSMSWAGKVGVK